MAQQGPSSQPAPAIRNDVDPETWRILYGKFATLLHINPWPWLKQKDFFAIRVPESDATAFLHFRGSGKDRELLIVLGESDEASYLAITSGIDHANLRSFETSTVRVLLRDVEAMTDFERAAMQTAGAVPDADGRAPIFVRYRPGWIPWALNRKEAVATASVLNQALGIILRAETDKSIVIREDPRRLWRRAYDAKSSEWKESWVLLPQFTDIIPGPLPRQTLIDKVNALPEVQQPFEIDIDVLPRAALVNKAVMSACNGGALPVGYFLVIADSSRPEDPSSALHGSIMYPCGDTERFWRSVPKLILDAFVAIGRRPHGISVSSARVMTLLRPLQTKIHFRLTFHERLPRCAAIMGGTMRALDEAIEKLGHGNKPQ